MSDTMDFGALGVTLTRQPAPLPVYHGKLSGSQWTALAEEVFHRGGRLIALWATPGDGMTVSAAFGLTEGLLWANLPLPSGHTVYPALSTNFPCAVRMERALYDLSGLRAEGATDQRPWLNHGAWPADWHPLSLASDSKERFPDHLAEDYPFVRVEGDGVHEIPVGPVHAGIIEPGHFRFSIVGERVLRLEQRLGYKHKGIEQRFRGMGAYDGYRLAGRVSGDTTVAFAWAYAMAYESSQSIREPERARWLRALMLERERVANHLGDLGALGNDAAFGFGLAQFMRLKEDWLRLNLKIFGHRFMMDNVVPGGVRTDISAEDRRELQHQSAVVIREVSALQSIYEEHQGLQDRFVTTGRVPPDLAAQLGLTGLAGRASGIDRDLRTDYPFSPYADLGATRVSHRNGDVAARVAVRFGEVFESLRLIDKICARMPEGSVLEPIPPFAMPGEGIGWVEGWRGEVLVALVLDEQGKVCRCHCHDPSWQNWPVLEHAVIGNIVPDFPLINKSFNLSYAGQDL